MAEQKGQAAPSLSPEPYYSEHAGASPVPRDAEASSPEINEAKEMDLRPDLAQALVQEHITKEDGRYLIYYTFNNADILDLEKDILEKDHPDNKKGEKE